MRRSALQRELGIKDRVDVAGSQRGVRCEVAAFGGAEWSDELGMRGYSRRKIDANSCDPRTDKNGSTIDRNGLGQKLSLIRATRHCRGVGDYL